MRKVLTIGIVARRLGQHPSTLDRLNRQGLFPHVQAVDGCRFWEPDLIAAIEAHSRNGRVSVFWIMAESKIWAKRNITVEETSHERLLFSKWKANRKKRP